MTSSRRGPSSLPDERVDATIQAGGLRDGFFGRGRDGLDGLKAERGPASVGVHPEFLLGVGGDGAGL